MFRSREAVGLWSDGPTFSSKETMTPSSFVIVTKTRSIAPRRGLFSPASASGANFDLLFRSEFTRHATTREGRKHPSR